MIRLITPETLETGLNALARKDKRIRDLIRDIGFPPIYSRPKGFPGLVRIILEQQVSLISAQKVHGRLLGHLGRITPDAVAAMPADEFKTVGITRQKTTYIKGLGQAILDGFDLDPLETLDDQEVKYRLTAIKGIGPWTAEIYLIMSLHRMDIFPCTDLALVKALRSLGFIPLEKTRPGLEAQVRAFAPYKSLMAFMLWHWYIIENRISLPEEA